MDSNLNILEAKVLEAVGLIKELRAENQQLKDRCEDLSAQVDETEKTNSRLNHQLEEARQQAGSVEDFEEKRKEIEDKVGSLLQKLEGLG
jgi:chromosome segregation ATPase